MSTRTVPLSDDEIRDRGERLAELVQRRDAADEEMRAAAKTSHEHIAGLDAEITRLAREIKTGTREEEAQASLPGLACATATVTLERDGRALEGMAALEELGGVDVQVGPLVDPRPQRGHKPRVPRRDA